MVAVLTSLIAASTRPSWSLSEVPLFGRISFNTSRTVAEVSSAARRFFMASVSALLRQAAKTAPISVLMLVISVAIATVNFLVLE